MDKTLKEGKSDTMESIIPAPLWFLDAESNNKVPTLVKGVIGIGVSFFLYLPSDVYSIWLARRYD